MCHVFFCACVSVYLCVCASVCLCDVLSVCLSLKICVSVCLQIVRVRCVVRAFLDGYCSTVQGLLDWFEVDLGFTELLFIQIDLCVLCVFSKKMFSNCES